MGRERERELRGLWGIYQFKSRCNRQVGKCLNVLISSISTRGLELLLAEPTGIEISRFEVQSSREFCRQSVELPRAGPLGLVRQGTVRWFMANWATLDFVSSILMHFVVHFPTAPFF